MHTWSSTWAMKGAAVIRNRENLQTRSAALYLWILSSSVQHAYCTNTSVLVHESDHWGKQYENRLQHHTIIKDRGNFAPCRAPQGPTDTFMYCWWLWNVKSIMDPQFDILTKTESHDKSCTEWFICYEQKRQRWLTCLIWSVTSGKVKEMEERKKNEIEDVLFPYGLVLFWISAELKQPSWCSWIKRGHCKNTAPLCQRAALVLLDLPLKNRSAGY